MKRSRSEILDCVANYTRSKKRRLHPPLEFVSRRKQWLSPSRLRNFMIRDTLADWLELYTRNAGIHNRVHEGGFIEFIQNKGVEFEQGIIDHINDHRIPIVSVSEYITSTSVKRTIDLMKAGTPVIHSAPLKNHGHRTMGVVDLLVRSDYLSRIVEECPLTEDEQKIAAPKLNGNYHYVVIDVKFSTLPLRADGRHLLNSGSYPFYKTQTWIYTQAVGKIQGYTPRSAYILGRRWNYTSRGIKYNSLYSLDKLGIIDFEGVDKMYIDRTSDAIKWRREVEQFGADWSVSPPSREELRPNMCVDSGRWNPQKQKLADENKEITQIWYCGIKQRENAHTHGVTSWDDPHCTSQTLGMGGVRGPVIDAILNVNRQNQDVIRPSRIRSNMYNWRDSTKGDMFVDFETLMDIHAPMDELPKQRNTNQIFMIGVWYRPQITEQWVYKSFICRALTLDEEFRVMNEFVSFMKSQGSPRMWYWHAEKTMWASAENRQFDNCKDDEKKEDVLRNDWASATDDWCDMAKLFRGEPIVIKDCFKFGLKDIVKTMNKHGLIPTRLESDCDSGLTAAIKAWNAYQNSQDPANSPTIQDIAKYNEFDVKALCDILTYLRNHHA